MDRSIRQTARPDLASHYQARLVRHHRRLAVVGLMIWDQILILIGFAVAYWLRYVADWPDPLRAIVAEVATQNQVEFGAFLPILVPLMLLLAVRFATRGLYRSTPHLGLIEQIGIIVNSTLIVIALLIIFVFLYKPFYYSRLIFAVAGTLIVLLLSSGYSGTSLAVVTWYWPCRHHRCRRYWSWSAGDERDYLSPRLGLQPSRLPLRSPHR